MNAIITEKTIAAVTPADAAEKGLSGLLAAGCAPAVFASVTPNTAVLPLLHTLPAIAPLRLAALLAKSDDRTVDALLSYLRTSKEFAAGVRAYLAIVKEEIPQTPYEARRFVCRHFPHAEHGLLLKGALNGVDTADAALLCRRVLRDGTAVEIRRLAVNGKELQLLAGVRPEKTAALLAALQDLVWHTPTDNKRDILLAHAKQITKKENWL